MSKYEKGAYRATERLQFAHWLALAKKDRVFDGKELPSERDFADHIGVDKSTLWHWKQDPKFRSLVHKLRMNQIDQHIPEVLNKLVSRASDDGDTNAIKLVLEYAEEFLPTQRVINEDSQDSQSNPFESREFRELFVTEISDRLTERFGLYVEPEIVSEVLDGLLEREEEDEY